METTYLIIGAGIAGLSLAIGLQDRKIPFLICEAASEIKGIGAGFGLAANAMAAFKFIGIDKDVAGIGNPLNALNILDQNGKSIISGNPSNVHNDFADNYAIHRADLHALLLGKINPKAVLTNHKLIRLDNEKNNATFENGTTIQFKVLIGADGIHSAVRTLSLPNTQLRYSGYTCWRAVIENDQKQSFESFETWGANGRFGITPLTNNRIYWYACINTSLNDASIRDFNIDQLRQNFSAYHEQITTILKLTNQQQLMRHDIYDINPINQYAYKNIVLIGDAAHATTPNLGQGACLAIEDVAVYLYLIDRKYTQNVINKFFNQHRVDRCKSIVAKSKILGSVAQIENKTLITLRNFLFRNTPKSINHRQMRAILNCDFLPSN